MQKSLFLEDENMNYLNLITSKQTKLNQMVEFYGVKKVFLPLTHLNLHCWQSIDQYSVPTMTQEVRTLPAPADL